MFFDDAEACRVLSTDPKGAKGYVVFDLYLIPALFSPCIPPAIFPKKRNPNQNRTFSGN